jgi:hypothetical protein
MINTDTIDSTVEKEIVEIKKVLSRKRTIKNVQNSVLLALAIGAGAFAYFRCMDLIGKLYHDMGHNQRVSIVGMTYDELRGKVNSGEKCPYIAVNSVSVQQYQYNFEMAFENAKTAVIDGAQGLPLDSKLIDEEAKKNGLSGELLRHVIRANRIFADIDRTSNEKNYHNKTVNILDPFTWRTPEGRFQGAYDMKPVDNLKAGARRLGNLVKQNKGNIREALLDFYTSYQDTDGTFRNSSLERSGDKEKVKEVILSLVYCAETGDTSFAGDGGLHTIDLPYKVPHSYLNVDRIFRD